ncbi:hypothetical protein S7335_2303 [Synechococcus sp. PCC 7335]|nr:hypothetical protein S7335_2303 [Synechococcus sp. PCC 7335]
MQTEAVLFGPSLGRLFISARPYLLVHSRKASWHHHQVL